MSGNTLVPIIDALRHGATARAGFLGHLDVPLTPQGWAQMRAAVREGGPWDCAVSSPLTRCAEFAREFAALRGLPLHVDPRLRELHFGAWEGKDAQELSQTEPDALSRFWSDPYRHPPPGGETLEAFETRVLSAWRDLAERHAGQRLLVISHGGVIRMLLCHARGLARGELLRLDVPHASLHRIAPG